MSIDPTSKAATALRKGQIDAFYGVVGAPVTVLKALSPDEGLHLLPILNEGLRGAYPPVKLTAENYPGLVLSKQPIYTFA